MSSFLRELMVPGLVIIIVWIVWGTSQLADQDSQRVYYPADDPMLYLRVARQAARHHEEAPAVADVGIEP